MLNHKAEDEIYLMDTPSWMFQEPEATVVFGKFCDRYTNSIVAFICTTIMQVEED